MGDIKGFMKHKREVPQSRPVEERILDYKEIYQDFEEAKTEQQASRCMDCGVPFCHNGCPLGNIIPDFNKAVFGQDWQKAYEILRTTNNFPEFTGRICPAPCEKACVLGINNDPVSIEWIEKSISEKAYELSIVRPKVPGTRSGFIVAVIGSGPAGLAAADQLNQAGHLVDVFERNDKIGGLLRYGIPDFKLEKWIIDRRIQLMKEEGVCFYTNTNVGVDITANELIDKYDAIVLCGGSTVPRDLRIPGRQLNGVHFAMDFLEQKNRQVAGQQNFSNPIISANAKRVVVIGGGDTGADCVGSSNREKASSVTQIELLAMPPLERHPDTPWPLWPMQLRSSSSHEEGCERKWSILTKEFIGDEAGNLKALRIVDIDWVYNRESARSEIVELPDTLREIPCELALLAMGFVHPLYDGLLRDLKLTLEANGTVKTTGYQTTRSKVFSAGDMRRGQSLVVWAIAEGREAAIEVDEFLTGARSKLDSKRYSKLLV